MMGSRLQSVDTVGALPKAVYHFIAGGTSHEEALDLRDSSSRGDKRLNNLVRGRDKRRNGLRWQKCCLMRLNIGRHLPGVCWRRHMIWRSGDEVLSIGQLGLQ
jgi:hypothetical protein